MYGGTLRGGGSGLSPTETGQLESKNNSKLT
jgi:hypothetical protein